MNGSGMLSFVSAAVWSGAVLSIGAPVSAQANWSPATSPLSPPSRFLHGFCNGPGSTMVLFGGLASGVMQSDTWFLDPLGWHAATPASAPPARFGHAMAFDLLRGRVVLFGGATLTASGLADTWEWDGASWLLRSPAHSPTPRQQAAMDYDLQRGVTVLFSGFGFLAGADTWEWDGTDWRLIATSHAPAARTSSAMAYDLRRSRMVLFGGYSGGMLGDTWEYDGTDWQLRAPAQSPPLRCCNALAADWVRERVVLFGGAIGATSGDFGDIWEYDGITWRHRTPAASPSPRRGMPMAFDIGRGRTVLFGGGPGNSGSPPLGDTWEYFSPTLPGLAPLAAGCAGTLGTPALVPNGQLWLGDAVQIGVAPAGSGALALLALGLSSTSWGAIALPASLASIGAPGCALAVSVDATLPMPPVGGVPTATLPLPPVNAFAGLSLFAQALVADPAANAAGFVLSDAIAMQLGAR
jgi:hypothetical protein